jgi:hypothetical protein
MTRMIILDAGHAMRGRQMKFRALGFAGAAIAMYAVPAPAHHSFAMFDGEKTVTLEGTVKAFQWIYPHSWILLMVPNSDGQLEQWPIEMGSPGGLAKEGWLPKTLTPGMKVTAVIHPLKDGTHGGQYLAVTLSDGRTLGLGNVHDDGGGDAGGQGPRGQ